MQNEFDTDKFKHLFDALTAFLSDCDIKFEWYCNHKYLYVIAVGIGSGPYHFFDIFKEDYGFLYDINVRLNLHIDHGDEERQMLEKIFRKLKMVTSSSLDEFEVKLDLIGCLHGK